MATITTHSKLFEFCLERLSQSGPTIPITVRLLSDIEAMLDDIRSGRPFDDVVPPYVFYEIRWGDFTKPLPGLVMSRDLIYFASRLCFEAHRQNRRTLSLARASELMMEIWDPYGDLFELERHDGRCCVVSKPNAKELFGVTVRVRLPSDPPEWCGWFLGDTAKQERRSGPFV